MLLSRIVPAVARITPHAPAISAGGETLTYAQLHDRVARLAGALTAQGVQPGDRVALYGRACRQFVEAELAAVAVGAIPVPIATRLSPADLRHIMADADPRLLVYGQECTDAAREVECPSLGGRLAFDAGGDDPALDHLAARATPRTAWHEAAPDDVTLLIYTGGTTGTPKGVMHTHRSLTANLWLSPQAWQTWAPDSRLLVYGNIAHISGQISAWISLWLGWCVAFPDGAPGPLSADAVVELIERERLTHVTLIASLFKDVVDLPSGNSAGCRSLRHVWHGGAPASAATIEKAIGRFPGVAVMEAYASTESGLVITALDMARCVAEGTPKRLHSVGRPGASCETRLVDDEGRDVPAGQVGEVVCRGDAMMAGYWRNPAATREAIPDGWLRTGDLARLDEDGYLYLVDRKKDIIFTRAGRVYSAQVEAVLATHPAIRECAVVAAPAPEEGELVVAVVAPRSGEAPTLESVQRFCRQRLQAHQAPTRLEVVDELPRTAMFKVDKPRLRERFWQGHARRIN
jgi:acyl-CoA synthetase (AMP-forming)/AMP-acid ligase II